MWPSNQNNAYNSNFYSTTTDNIDHEKSTNNIGYGQSTTTNDIDYGNSTSKKNIDYVQDKPGE